MSYSHLLVEKGAVARVTLNRPQVKNAMDDQTLRELADAFSSLSQDPALRAVVVSGAGADFCAGADIQWMRKAGTLPPEQSRKDAGLLGAMCRAIDECPVPVIAKVQGAIYGGGLGVVAACDIVVAEEKARMCFSECRLGILPAVVSCFVIPKIGVAAARRLYLTAEVFGMAAAKELGLIHEIAPQAELDAKVEGVVANVLKNGPQAVRECKALLKKLQLRDLDANLKLTIDTLVRVRSSPEGQEGLAAFLEKRPASWIRAKP